MPHPSPVIKEMSSLSNITLEKPGISNKRKNTKGEEVGAFINLHCNITVRGFVRYGHHMETTIIPVVDPGEGPPYFWTKLRPEGLKKFWGGRPLHPYLRVWMTAPPSPPPRYLKVWIRH